MNKRWARRCVASIAMIMAVLFVNISGSLAQEVPFRWNHIDVKIDVQENGDMLVTENQEYEFTANHTNQRYRYIPLDGIGSIEDVTVEEKNKIIPSKVGIENKQFWIRWQHQLNAPEVHTFILKYRVVGGLQVESESTRVYWQAIFGDRKAVINRANVVVKLPEKVAGKVTSFRSYGVKSDSQKLDERTFIFTRNKPLSPGEKLAVELMFPKAIFALPQKSSKNKVSENNSVVGAFLVILTIAVFIAFFLFTILWMFGFLREKPPLCPVCESKMFKRTSRVLSDATPTNPGKMNVVIHCKSCLYHHEQIFLVPYSYHEGGGGGGGGGDGGGG
jgi:Predicted membrane protein (DUF2207)